MATSSKLSILLYGDYHWDRLAPSYQRAFEHLGHQIIAFNTRQIESYLSPWLRHRVGHRVTINSLAARRLGATRWNRHLQETATKERPELVFIVNGEFVMPETLRAIRARGIPVFIFHADNPFPENAAHRPELLPCALESDCYFIWSRTLEQRLRALGVRNVQSLSFAWDDQIFPYIEPSSNPAHDLVFIGGWDQERESALTPLAQEFSLKIWGPDYWHHRTQPDSPLRGCWQGREIVGKELAHTVADSKIVLNILRRQNLPDGTNMRTFEVPGCGGFMLSTYSDGANEIFPQGKAGAYFRDTPECIAQIKLFLKQEDQRRAIADEAHKRVSQGQQYLHRAERILEVYRESITTSNS